MGFWFDDIIQISSARAWMGLRIPERVCAEIECLLLKSGAIARLYTFSAAQGKENRKENHKKRAGRNSRRASFCPTSRTNSGRKVGTNRPPALGSGCAEY